MGYTAAAVLGDARAERVLVIEKVPPAIHRQENGLILLGKQLTHNHKVQFVEGNFFGSLMAQTGLTRLMPANSSMVSRWT